MQSTSEQFFFFVCFRAADAGLFWSQVGAITEFCCFAGLTLVKVRVLKDNHNFFIHITDPKKDLKEIEMQEINEEQKMRSG